MKKDFSTLVQEKVQDLSVKHQYSIGFYTGGKSIEYWKTLTFEEEKKALKDSKPWYIYWAYRNPKTGKMIPQNNIKRGVNRLKTVEDRLKFMRDYARSMKEVFKDGYNPFDELDDEIKRTKAHEALDKALAIKKKEVGKDTHYSYELTLIDFKKFLKRENKLNVDISFISRKLVTKYLNEVLEKVSVYRRNKHRTHLNILFTTLAGEFIIQRNFIEDIPVLRYVKKEKRLNLNDLVKAVDYIKEHDPVLLLYIKLVSYSFLRIIEIARLKISDIDFEYQEMHFDQKTKKGKTKHLPNICAGELKQYIGNTPGDLFVFTPDRKPALWNRDDKGRRDYWTRQFQRVKYKLKLDCNMYDFRHYFITSFYLLFRKKLGLTRTEAIEKLMKITGHHSFSGISNYIHEKDVEKPEDWSVYAEQLDLTF